MFRFIFIIFILFCSRLGFQRWPNNPSLPGKLVVNVLSPVWLDSTCAFMRNKAKSQEWWLRFMPNFLGDWICRPSRLKSGKGLKSSPKRSMPYVKGKEDKDGSLFSLYFKNRIKPKSRTLTWFGSPNRVNRRTCLKGMEGWGMRI